MNVTNRAEKVDGVIRQVSMLSSWVMVLKLSKKSAFSAICSELSQKPKSVKVIYIYGIESSYYSLSENDIV